MKRKKILITLSIIILSIGIVFCFVVFKNKNDCKKLSLSSSKARVTSTKRVTSANSKKNLQNFNKTVISKDYFVEVKNQNGSTALEKATDANLSELEQDNDNKFVIYQIEQNGKTINVIGEKE